MSISSFYKKMQFTESDIASITSEEELTTQEDDDAQQRNVGRQSYSTAADEKLIAEAEFIYVEDTPKKTETTGAGGGRPGRASGAAHPASDKEGGGTPESSVIYMIRNGTVVPAINENFPRPPLTTAMTNLLDSTNQLVMTQVHERNQTEAQIADLKEELKDHINQSVAGLEDEIVVRVRTGHDAHTEEINKMMKQNQDAHKEEIRETIREQISTNNEILLKAIEKMMNERLESFHKSKEEEVRKKFVDIQREMERQEEQAGNQEGVPEGAPRAETARARPRSPNPGPEDNFVHPAPRPSAGTPSAMPPPPPPGLDEPRYPICNDDLLMPERTLAVLKNILASKIETTPIPSDSAEAYITILGHIGWDKQLDRGSFRRVCDEVEQAEQRVTELKKAAVVKSPMIHFTRLFEAQLERHHLSSKMRAAGSLLHGIACDAAPTAAPASTFPSRDDEAGNSRKKRQKRVKAGRTFNYKKALKIWSLHGAYREVVATMLNGDGPFHVDDFSAARGIYATIGSIDYAVALGQPEKIVHSEDKPQVFQDGASVIELGISERERLRSDGSAPVANRGLGGLTLQQMNQNPPAWAGPLPAGVSSFDGPPVGAPFKKPRGRKRGR